MKRFSQIIFELGENIKTPRKALKIQIVVSVLLAVDLLNSKSKNIK